MDPGQRKDTSPWYRQPMPIFVFSLPLAAVVASFVSMALAIEHRDALVSGDYYKQGIAVNERIERDETAARGNISANVTFTQQGTSDSATVELSGHPEVLAAGGTPILKLMHPTDDGQDLTIVLSPGAGQGAWQGTCLPPSAKVAWHITLENSRWRIGTLAPVHPAAGARLVSLVAAE